MVDRSSVLTVRCVFGWMMGQRDPPGDRVSIAWLLIQRRTPVTKQKSGNKELAALKGIELLLLANLALVILDAGLWALTAQRQFAELRDEVHRLDREKGGWCVERGGEAWRVSGDDAVSFAPVAFLHCRPQVAPMVISVGQWFSCPSDPEPGFLPYFLCPSGAVCSATRSSGGQRDTRQYEGGQPWAIRIDEVYRLDDVTFLLY